MLTEQVKFGVLLAFPIFIIWLLYYYYDKLNEKEMKVKIGTLYSKIKLHSELTSLPFTSTSYFLFRRFLIAVTTVLLQYFRLMQIAAYMTQSMLALTFTLTVQPYEVPLFNRLEIFNEFFILITSYFMLLCLDLFYDVEMKYEVGKIYNYTLYAVTAINLFFALYYMVTDGYN